MPKRARSDDAASPGSSSSPPRPPRSPSVASRSVRQHRIPEPSPSPASASASTSTSHTLPKRGRRRRDEAASPSNRRRLAPHSRGTANWTDLPIEILEMVFVKLMGPARAPSQVCYRWRLATMSFPRPVIYYPAPVGRILAPTTVLTRGANIARSTEVLLDKGVHSFSYVTLPALGSHPALRLIGGSPSVPLFINNSQRTLVASRFIGPPGSLPNAQPETLLSINLPQGVASHEIYCCIFAVGSRSTPFHLLQEINKFKGVFLISKSSMYGFLFNDSRASGCWTSIKMPLLEGSDRKFISALSFGGLTYFMDQTYSLLSCNMDMFGDIHTDEQAADRNMLFDCHIKTLKTWTLHLSLGEDTDDPGILCLRYEYNHPRCFRFGAYDLVVGEGRTWRVRRELRGFCIFIGWGPGAEAFAYWHPERIGLSSGVIYDPGQGMKPYFLKRRYQNNVMPPLKSLTWPFPLWIQQSFSIPYVPLPRRRIMDDVIPALAGDNDAVKKAGDKTA